MKNEIQTFDELNELISSYIKSPKEKNKIYEAYSFALVAHDGKVRKTNDNYISHPLNVAYILAGLNVDYITIIGALLHETINNGNSSINEIKEQFGEEIANVVATISKINKIKLSDDSESSALYMRKIIVGMCEDVRILYIKLADRLHNMRTSWALDPQKQIRKATETTKILIPIAHRLGINTIKSELEDLCLKYLKPDIYEDIKEKLSQSNDDLNIKLVDMIESVSNILIEHNINYEIKGRVKSIHSIYNKLNKGKKLDQIYDILALRILVESESDCYLVLGLIHNKFRALPNRFKDYITMPKENMYQSLHTTIFGIDGQLFEIQIRTYDMDEFAEHGIASHWAYKEKSTQNIHSMMEQKLEIFRNIIDAQTQDSDSELIQTFNSEFLNDSIYVFTPKGDVIELPQGATPIDFAYRIHSQVGDKTIGAIVNDNIVPLNHELNNNDIVSIKTNSSANPSKEWLTFVATPQAKNKIKAYFSRQDRDLYEKKGQELIEKSLRKKKLVFHEIFNEENLNKIYNKLKIKNLEDLYLAIGSLRYTPTYIINLITENNNIEDTLLEKKRQFKDISNIYHNDIIVAGINDIKVSLAHCCSPVKGDKIVGYVTKGEGITIHRSDCDNVKHLNNRFIDVEWNMDTKNLYNLNLLIKTNSTDNHLLDILNSLVALKINVSSFNVINNQEYNNYRLTIGINNIDDLNKVINVLAQFKYVKKVERV